MYKTSSALTYLNVTRSMMGNIYWQFAWLRCNVEWGNQNDVLTVVCEWRSVWSFAVYDSGTVFDPCVLDITDDDLRSRFLEVGLHLAQ